MSHHIHYNHECQKCGAYYIPFDQKVPCPKCGEVESERFDFIPRAAESAQFNFLDLGRYVPDAWSTPCFGDHILFIVFRLLEQHRIDTTGRTFSDVATEVLASMDWGNQLYLRDHIHDIACRVREQLKEAKQSRPQKTFISRFLDIFKAKKHNPNAVLNKTRPTSVLTKAQELSGQLIVSGYRRIFSEGNIGASPDMPDLLILKIYSEVGIKFRDVARQRCEVLETDNLHMGTSKNSISY